MAQKLKFGNGTWATKEGSTLAYNDENNNYKPLPFTTTRNSIATRVNKEGLIEVVGNDVPRIDYTDSSDGALLLEPSRTNLITYSQEVSNWSIISSGIVITNNTTDVLSPSGKNDASKVEFNAASKILGQSPTLSGDYSGFIYVKGTQGETIRFNFGGTEDNFTLTGGWDKLERTNITATANAFNLNTFGGATARNIYLYGAQLEQGSYPTSYIPTSGSSVTRQADTASGSGNSEVFNDSEGVLFADIGALSNDLTNRKLSISNGASSQRIVLSYSTVSNTLDYDVVNSTQQVDISHTLNDIKLFSKVAAKYKTNDFSLWINGFEVATDTNGNAPTDLSELNFDRGFGGENLYSKTKEVGYYDTALTDEELEYITSYRSLNELVTELNLNTL